MSTRIILQWHGELFTGDPGLIRDAKNEVTGLNCRSLNPKLFQMMVKMFPGRFAPVLFGELAKYRVMFAGNVYFSKAIYHFYQGTLFFFKIFFFVRS